MQGMQDWLQREKNMSDLFSPNVIRGRNFQQAKLDYLRDMEKNIGPNATRDEKMTLKILRGERRDLERRLYPNLIVRAAVKIAKAIKDMGIIQNNKSPVYERTSWMMKTSAPAKNMNENKNTLAQKDQVIKKDTRSVPRMMEKKQVTKQQGRRI